MINPVIRPVVEATLARPFWKAVIWTANRMLQAAGARC